MHTIQMPMVLSTPDEEVYNFGYGLGWCTGFYRGRYYLHHDGGIDGFISQVSLLPQEKIGVVVLTNSSSDGAFAVSCITNTIIDKLLEETNVDWTEKSKNQREQIKKAQQETPNRNNEPISTPAHQLEDYVGHYEHPAYGIIQVKLENDQLLATYGEMVTSLSCKCYDIFNGKIDEALLDKSTIIFSFANNTSGDICELSVPLDQTVKPIIFKRKADNDLFSLEYLKQFEGLFGDKPLSVEVSLRNNKLFLISPGMGGETELAPDKRLKFNLKGLPEHYIQFRIDDGGKVTEFIFTHPLGSLNFKINT